MFRVTFEPDTEVRLLRYHCLRITKEEDKAKIYYCTENAKVYHEEEEQMLEIDPSHLCIIETLQKAYPDYVQIANLPISDDLIKFQIISDFWEHGLIVTKEPLDIIE